MSKHKMSQFNQIYNLMLQTTKRWRVFGAYVKTERENSRLSQEGLGDLIGRDRQTIYRIENGLGGTTRETVIKLAEAMSLDLEITLNKAGFSLQEGIEPVAHKPLLDAIARAGSSLSEKDTNYLVDLIGVMEKRNKDESGR